MVTVPSGSRLRGIRYRTARSAQRYTIASRTKAIVNIRSFIGSTTMISKFVVRSQIVGKKVETRISACKGTEGGDLRLVIPSAARNLLCRNACQRTRFLATLGMTSPKTEWPALRQCQALRLRNQKQLTPADSETALLPLPAPCT